MKDNPRPTTPVTDPIRRALLVAASLSPLLSIKSFADSVTELTWQDLLPEGVAPLPGILSGLVLHENAALASLQPRSTGVRHDWDGQIVKLSGYIVPLDFEGTGVTTFILVPYVGACIHVPPPPANQLVLVNVNKPYKSTGLFGAVSATGTFGSHTLSTNLAEIGYALDAHLVETLDG